MKAYLCYLTPMFVLTVLAVNPSTGHEIFQDVLKEKYALKSFSCKTCHQDADNRKLRTPFAELYYQEMKGDNWSDKYAQAEAKGEEALAAFEIEIGEAFKKTLDTVGKKTLTVEDLFASGLLAGVRIDDKKRKALDSKKEKTPSATAASAIVLVKSAPVLHQSRKSDPDSPEADSPDPNVAGHNPKSDE